MVALQRQSIYSRSVELFAAPLALSAFNYTVIYLFGLGWEQALWDSLILFTLLVVFTSALSVIRRFYHTKKVLSVPNTSTIILFSFLTLIIHYGLLNGFWGHKQAYIFLSFDLMLIRGLVLILYFTLVTTLYWIGQQRVESERLQRYVVEKERESIRIELNSLQQQFKPHFLFNSLNSISALCAINPEEARTMIHLLSDFMRKSVKEGEATLLPLKEEIEHIQRYTSIEKIRFGDRLKVRYEIEEGLDEFNVPSLILQPIIENAIKYGLYGNLGQVEIVLMVHMENDHLAVIATNPFEEESQKSSAGTGYGISSIQKKLLLLYKRSDLLETKAEDDLFTVKIRIPKT